MITVILQLTVQVQDWIVTDKVGVSFNGLLGENSFPRTEVATAAAA